MWFVVWHVFIPTHRLDGTIMNWQQARVAFEKNFAIQELTNSYLALAMTVRNSKNIPAPIKVTLRTQSLDNSQTQELGKLGKGGHINTT
jgi:hypothetical protein